MGVVGLHYDTHPFNPLPSVYFGLGGYGGAEGEEGGYFTMGGTIGSRHQLAEKVGLDLGFHFGGGGGSDLTFPGGGMIVRGHAAVEFPIADYALRVGIAHTEFPNTDQPDHADTHIMAGLRLNRFGWRHLFDSDSGGGMEFVGALSRFRAMPSVMYYATDDDRPIKRDGTYTDGVDNNADFGLLGVQLDYFSLAGATPLWSCMGQVVGPMVTRRSRPD